ncbi:MAG TPA: MXAN_6640 family putative metalloprotease [Phototrophicaceae bacterium]|nr:MXAN_6640 family putative metalloprotease [Phototrophicaceae bacterium]
MLKSFLAALLLLLLFQTVQAQQPQTQSYTGHLDDTVDNRDYKIDLKSGDAVSITADAAHGSDLDAVLTLYDPDDQQVAANDDADISTYDARIGYIAHADGVYRVNVARYDKTTSGNYTLTVKIGDTSVLDYDEPLSGTRRTVDTQHFRFHYTTSGADAVSTAFLQAIEKAFDDAWHIEIDKMGWPAPPSDGVMGGNGLFDVYVKDLIGSSDGNELGFTSSEIIVGDNPSTPEVEKNATTAYIAIDNDFRSIDLNPGETALSVMRSTAFHEFNHALQFGFDGVEPDTWLLESTATWMETAAAGKDQDATGYVSEAFQYPELCLGTTAHDNADMYGEWPFMQFLTDEFGKNAVIDLWKQIADYDGFDAVEHYLESVGTDVPHEVARYRINNLARNYKLAPLFKATVWLENSITKTGNWTHASDDDGVQELGASYFVFSPTPGNYDVELRNDQHKLELWAIGVTKDDIQAIDLGRGGGIDTRNYQLTYLMVFNPTYQKDVGDCHSVDYQINVAPGKGTTNPVDSTFSRTYFQPLTAENN